ncbi:glucose dehydrogenase [FAD, quinone]-like [Episyrphus balteatus]|uniref:glucose dehydrogenase [FAD, quinone]-like n=1 Tax=Episyrphus balteatus TaxID=286459 RepID=UPI002485F1A5|nr:glucose dehydrogenase [FAD, quinone]-like [Episyrphus balteatus]
MIHSRGNRKDFDEIAAAGNSEWSYDEVLPYFLRSERANLWELNNSPYHNNSGKWSIVCLLAATIFSIKQVNSINNPVDSVGNQVGSIGDQVDSVENVDDIDIQQILADANSCTSSFSYKAPDQNSTYDFIIVGAGPAGSALANRLSENPKHTVYLLEAGGPECLAHQMPVLTIGLQQTDTNYGYTTVPQKHACFAMKDNICKTPQGKSLGGSSSLSYGIYNRGVSKNYDDWAALGNDGWSYEEVLPFFLKSENASLRKYQDSQYHNYSGEYISNEDVKYRTEIPKALIQGCQDAGLDYIDYNDPTTGEGCSYTQADTRNGRRYSAFRAYIEPVQADRPNLHVLPNALVTRILINLDTKTAYGVEFEYNGEKYTILASKEVILSAGPFHSAQLLIVSGIGPEETLKEIDVPLVLDLPVGKTLRDHTSHIGPLFTLNTTLQTLFIDRITPIDITEFLAGSPSTRVSTLSGVEASAYINSNLTEGLNRDVELISVSATISVDYGTIFKEVINMRDDVYNKVYKPTEGVELFGFLTMLYYPESTGSLWVTSSDVKIPPKIDPNYYSESIDVEKILEGIKRSIEITSMPGMQAINATLIRTKVPGCEKMEFESDDYWRCSIRAYAFSLHHYSATCKMGPASDDTSVVDSDLIVHGMNGLRVIDTSVVPNSIGGHMSAVGYMIGEKGADILKKFYD